MGGNWFDALGGNWISPMGGNWVDAAASPGPQVFAMRADRPLAEIPVQADLTATFRASEWDPDLIALAILPQFMKAKVGTKTWDAAIALPAPAAITQPMIDDLLLLAITERPDALPEIVQQHQNFQTCWLQLLNISRASHPQTYLLMKLIARCGELAMMVLKLRHPARPRPSQVCPTLYPPVPVPGHSSYPAGHALIGSFTSACLAELFPPPAQAQAQALTALAARVGFNRVIAGLHFRQDVDVGLDVGLQLKPFIKQCQLYKDTLAAAQAEWA
ncbi:phosphoesterase PA-phosphatase related [Methylobacterium sp. 4-46]|uniref:phosphatase PAP2 family protein n=1 Tax=unclassified Methylobacterium TaxID=2615210 RepID=UPI000165C819|nr:MULTISPECIES: phosphatase PAP2 family protein [Methylobacterium]ACA15663.1 phosphoesterase PA-phosphatase related [Methylobacterium sp. 4-46]WFT81375.1 phosphatase PAP2 family protein [Methylobacterium nodulans]WFT81423.1 phosphatase PAP2 family protein [Methylobacterium nodulans]